MAAQITITASAPPRGQGSPTPQTVALQSVRGSFAWGGSPGSATMVFVNNGGGNMTGQLIELELGAHYFAGICKSDTTQLSTKGELRELQFVDLREFLAWDYVYCAFNMPIRRWENGVWKKRWWHIYPWDYPTYTKTYTDYPLPASAIVGALFTAPTVNSPWVWNLTGNGLFPGGLMNQPVYSFDCLNGVRLDAALNDISDRGGLVYTLDPYPGANYRLVWMRKGYGLIPVLPPFDWPANSDDRRLGVALSGNASTVRVTGERNRYLVLNVPLKPDWNAAWEQFLNSDGLFWDIFQNEKDPATGVAYTNFPNDPEQWLGANAAKVRALQITVGEYADLRDARPAADGDDFRDTKKFAGRSRMDMPAALYLQSLLFRAYVPNPAPIGGVAGIQNVNGDVINLNSANITDAQPCRVTYDPVTGNMEADRTTLADGNGVGIVQGTSFGQDLFELVKPERITNALFSANNRPWSSVSFQIDETGGDGQQRFIVFDEPVFTSENLLVQVDGLYLLNATPTLTAAVAQAALTFELEPYSYWQGPAGRVRSEYVSGLCAEFAGTYADGYREILYANGATADRQAAVIASNLLLCQYTYVSGGYKLIQWNAPLGTALTSIIDRVEVEFNPSGFVEVVDLTTERERAHFEPERDLERRTVQNTLFPGQSELRNQAREYQRFGAGLKGFTRDQMSLLINFLKGNFGPEMASVRFNPNGAYPVPAGDTVPGGTPLFGPAVTITDANQPANTLAEYPPNYTAAGDPVFLGVTVREGENANQSFWVRSQGDVACLVRGPVAVGDSLGPADNYDNYDIEGAYLVNGGQLGVAKQAIPGNDIVLILVRLSAMNGGSDAWQP